MIDVSCLSATSGAYLSESWSLLPVALSWPLQQLVGQMRPGRSGGLCQRPIDGPSDRYTAPGPARDSLTRALVEPDALLQALVGPTIDRRRGNSQSAVRPFWRHHAVDLQPANRCGPTI